MGKAMSSDPAAPPVDGEILTGVQRRRRWSTTEKIRLVEKSQQPGLSVSFVARRYGISPSLLFSWKRRMPEYCRATPTECVPFFRKPVSSTTSTASGSARASAA